MTPSETTFEEKKECPPQSLASVTSAPRWRANSPPEASLWSVRLPARERRKAGSSHWRSGKRGTEQSRRRATRRQRRLHPLAGPMREAIAEVADLLPGKVVIDPSNPVSVGVDGPVGSPAPHVTSLCAA